MARANKYTAINFNDIYENKTTSTVNNHRRSSSSSTTATPGNKTILSNSRIHGNMLVLNLPSPKSVIPPPQPSPLPSPAASPQQSHPEDSISLRPLGRTGTGPPLSPLASPAGQNKNFPISPKTNKFVPPHLRPGFVGREEKQSLPNLRQVSFESPQEEERPKSGGGYERLMRGFDVDPVGINRSRSIGSTRPNSSG